MAGSATSVELVQPFAADICSPEHGQAQNSIHGSRVVGIATTENTSVRFVL